MKRSDGILQKIKEIKRLLEEVKPEVKEIFADGAAVREENNKKEQKDATIDNPVILDKIVGDVTEEKKHVTWAEKIVQLKKIPRRGKGKSLILLKQSKL